MPKDDGILNMVGMNLVFKYIIIVIKFFFYKKGEQLDITKRDFDMWKFIKFIATCIFVIFIIVLGNRLVNLAISNIQLKKDIAQCMIMLDKKNYDK